MSKIEWTEFTINPIVGCSKISAGCKNCYAERMACRLAAMGQKKYQEVTSGGGIILPDTPNKERYKWWNGKTYFDESCLQIPLKRKKPTMFFVSSMGDLFLAPFEQIDEVVATIALCPQHKYQFLTKRADRMLEYFEKEDDDGFVAEDRLDANLMDGGYPDIQWPLPNLWLGVTAENQEMADKRIPILLQIPAAVRFVSIEPCLGAIDLTSISKPEQGTVKANVLDRHGRHCGIDWVIVGGESGPGARFCNSDWAMSIVKQCKAAGVACFVKQLHDQKTGKLIKSPKGWPREYPK